MSDEADVFNQSAIMKRTPPVAHSTRSATDMSTNVATSKSEFMSKSSKIACNKCELANERTKIRCGKCRRWWHTNCNSTEDVPNVALVSTGAWHCKDCVKGDSMQGDISDDMDVTRVELGSRPMSKESTRIQAVSTGTKPKSIISKKPPQKKGDTIVEPTPPLNLASTAMPKSNKGIPNPAIVVEPETTAKAPPSESAQSYASKVASKPGSERSRKPSVLSSRSGASELAMLKLIDEEYEVEQAKLKLEERKLECKLAQIRKKQSVIASGSERSRSRAGSSVHSQDRVEEWVQKSPPNLLATRPADIPKQSRPKAKEEPAQQPRRAIFNPNLTVSQFVEHALQEDEDFTVMLTASQVRARQVLSKDLPEFDGDPIDWPTFIARYTDSTRRCGFNAVENLERLSKCLKGQAYRVVQSELHKKDALPGVLATLQMLFGRPEVVYDALIECVKGQPEITEANRAGIIQLSLGVKTVCEALSSEELQPYLLSPLLMLELVEKLPETYRISWGNYQADKEDMGELVTVETFERWLRRQAEIYAKVHRRPVPTTISSKSRVNLRPKKGDLFNHAHEVVESKSSSESLYQGAHEKIEGKRSGWKGYCHICKHPGHVTFRCPELMNANTDDRWKLVSKHKLCIKCLGRHLLRDCGLDTVCGISGCERPHHRLLHTAKPTTRSVRETKPAASQEEAIGSGRSSPKTVMMHADSNAKYRFQIVPIIVSNGADQEEQTYAFLDSGSEITLMDAGLAKRLKLKGPTERLNLKWSNDVSRVEPNSRRVQPTIYDVSKQSCFNLRNVRTVEKLQLPIQNTTKSTFAPYSHLKGVPIVNDPHAKPEILIGLDNFQLLTAQETIEGGWDEPVAIKTRIGWTVFGSMKKSDEINALSLNTNLISNDELKASIDEYFSLENIGIQAPKAPLESHPDHKARKLMEEGCKQLENGRYEVNLLWKEKKPELPDSYNMAVARLKHFERKTKNEDTVEMVNKLIEEYHTRGYLVELSEKEERRRSPKTWYLPIFTVRNPNKPEKIRLVWDAAAKVNGVALNDCLYTGPDLTASLVTTLFKFREHQFAVGGDIEAMFHQIAISPEDQDAQRCLWRYTPNDKIRVSKMSVMTFGAACSPSIAQFIKNTNASKFEAEFPRAVEAIQNRHYVDDYLDSFETEQEASRVLGEVRKIHEAGKFNLRGIISNSEAVLIEHDEKGPVEDKLLNKDEEKVKVLGMWWRTTTDMLQYKLNIERMGEKIISKQEAPTKREVLRTLMMVFDPLGLIGFLILKGKLVLKGIWRSNVDWDEPIEAEDFKRWKVWMEDLEASAEIVIPRWYFATAEVEYYAMHVFVDAGEEASAAVAYLVKINGETKEVALVGSKTKVGPNKPTSIPRLELQAAVIGTRLGTTIREGHSVAIREITYWTDSRNVLCWIRSPRRFKVFVAHRIAEIRETTRAKDWRYVPTTQNPADFGTKWLKLREVPLELWFHGPDFLKQTCEHWPKEPENLPPLDECDLELRCNKISRGRPQTMCPPWDRFSSLNRLTNTQVYISRFFNWKRKGNDNKALATGIPTREEREQAIEYLIREAQQEVFHEELRALRGHESIKKTSIIRTYSPFLDPQGLIRMKGRLQDAEYLTYNQRCPIILPRAHELTMLIIRDVHERYLHQNHATVMNELRQSYTIPSLRAALKNLRANCYMCRRRASNPEVPEMSPLPRSRLAARIRPFTYVGVDYFGPLVVKIGRRVEKRWGALFTCLTTRAVHLELAGSLSSDSFIMVMRCFIARRGMPCEIYCDNGTNFRGAEHELRKISLENAKTVSEETYQQITWKFNPPNAPHMGGAWERLVRAVKASMKCLQTERVPTEELLRSILAECEMLINSRPLTYLNLSSDALEALTPNHFLLGSSSGVKPIGNFADDTAVLRTEWKRQQQIAEVFWKRFVAEYLPEISMRSKWHDKIEPAKVGDVVAIVNSSIPGSWQLGRIIATVTSKDGGIRQATIKTANGTYQRPASKFAILIREELRDVSTSSAGGGVKNTEQ